MTNLSFIECCHLFCIDPKTLRQWLAQAHMSLHTHPSDARIKCLSSEQVHVLANLHDRVLRAGVSGASPNSDEIQSQKSLTAVADADLLARLAQVEARLATLQAQLTDLALQLLKEREQRTEQRRLPLEVQSPLTWGLLPQEPSMPSQPAIPPLVCHPSEKRARLVPLIEYGARGRYVLICPKEGEVLITPNSPEWFAWLASLSSFRFVGEFGHFSARRGYNHRPNRGWYAQRTIHQKNYSKYIGVSENITTDRLEQIAAHFQLYMN